MKTKVCFYCLLYHMQCFLHWHFLLLLEMLCQTGETFNGKYIEVSNYEKMDLALNLGTASMNDISDNPSLRHETKTLLRDAHVEFGLTVHKHNQSKEKIKEINIVVENPSTEKKSNDLG